MERRSTPRELFNLILFGEYTVKENFLSGIIYNPNSPRQEMYVYDMLYNDNQKIHAKALEVKEQNRANIEKAYEELGI